MVLSFVHLVLYHSSTYTVVSKNRVSRGPSVLLLCGIQSTVQWSKRWWISLISNRNIRPEEYSCLVSHGFELVNSVASNCCQLTSQLSIQLGLKNSYKCLFPWIQVFSYFDEIIHKHLTLETAKEYYFDAIVHPA